MVSTRLLRAGSKPHSVSPVNPSSCSNALPFFIDAERWGSDFDLRRGPGMVSSPSFCKFDSGFWNSQLTTT